MKRMKILLCLAVALMLTVAVGCTDNADPDEGAVPNAVLPGTMDESSPAGDKSDDFYAAPTPVTLWPATDEILSEFEDTAEFSEGGALHLVFVTSDTAFDFRLIEVGHLEFEGSSYLYTVDVLHSFGDLLPDRPIVMSLTEMRDVPHRGITFIDERGTARYFAIVADDSIADSDSVYLEEFGHA